MDNTETFLRSMNLKPNARNRRVLYEAVQFMTSMKKDKPEYLPAPHGTHEVDVIEKGSVPAFRVLDDERLCKRHHRAAKMAQYPGVYKLKLRVDWDLQITIVVTYETEIDVCRMNVRNVRGTCTVGSSKEIDRQVVKSTALYCLMHTKLKNVEEFDVRRELLAQLPSSSKRARTE